MCLILVAWRHHPDFPLVIAANRDEFHARPALAAGFWPEYPDVCAGRDLQAGGTWLGVGRDGRFAALTNYRSMEAPPPNARSRGELPLRFLSGRLGETGFLAQLNATHEEYAGFSLLFGSLEGELLYFTNRGDGADPAQWLRIGAGIHGLSNHRLDTPWPKITGGKRALGEALRGTPDSEEILDLLADRTIPPDEQLPDNGIGIERERILAPRFISYPEAGYGTRASTCVMAGDDGWISIHERAYDAEARPRPLNSVRFRVRRDPR